MRECREVVQNAGWIPNANLMERDTLFIEFQINMILSAFRKLIYPEDNGLHTEMLLAMVRVGISDISGKEQLIEYLQGDEFKMTLGLYYFANALARADYVEKSGLRPVILREKNYIIIPVVGEFLMDAFPMHLLSSKLLSSNEINEKCMLVVLRRMIIAHHNAIWEGISTLKLPDGNRPASLVGFLRTSPWRTLAASIKTLRHESNSRSFIALGSH